MFSILVTIPDVAGRQIVKLTSLPSDRATCSRTSAAASDKFPRSAGTRSRTHSRRSWPAQPGRIVGGLHFNSKFEIIINYSGCIWLFPAKKNTLADLE